MAIGTKVQQHFVSNTTSTSSPQQSVDKKFYATVTAYTANCSGCSGLTATGFNLQAHPNAKVVAVDPDVIPLGSTVWVEGYGVAQALDVGGAINGHNIDVFIPSKARAMQFGVQKRLVKVLD